MIKKTSSQSGFALLVTILVIGAVTAIGLSLLELTMKQVRLSYVSNESERAFHATNAGAECARFWRRQESVDFESGSGSISGDCFGDNDTFGHTDAVADTNITVEDGAGTVHRYEANFGWDSNDRCTEIDMLVAVVDVSAIEDLVLGNVDDVYPGYTGAGGELTCGIGGRCTLISVRGYGLPFTVSSGNPCDSGNLTSLGTIQRELLLQF